MTDGVDIYERLKKREIERHRRHTVDHGLPQMTLEELKHLCVVNDGYETPELNDKLYAHFKGFTKIENLDHFTGLKALWLESNGIKVIENLEKLVLLRCLYLQQNLIERIENLENLQELATLDLSQNQLTEVSNLSCLKKLTTLNLSKNHLYDADSIRHLSECSSIQNLDLSLNKIEEGDVTAVLTKMSSLTALKMEGNPIVSKTKHFRKTMIVKLPSLNYLDRPIFELERVGTMAWQEGGLEAERAARENFKQAERNEHRRQMEDFRKWQKEVRERKLESIRAMKESGGGEVDYFAVDVEGKKRESAQTPDVVRQGIHWASEREEHRRQQALADAEEERRLVNGDGIRQLGTQFWASQGENTSLKNDHQSAEVLETMVDQSEEKFQQVQDASEMVDPEAEQEKASLRDLQPETIREAIVERREGTELGHGDARDMTKDQLRSGGDETEFRFDTQQESNESDPAQNETMLEEDEEQLRIRRQRVQESLRLHYDRKKSLQNNAFIEEPTPVPTWQRAPVTASQGPYKPPENNNKAQALTAWTWNEKRDAELLIKVRECIFDFDEVADKMSKAGVELPSGMICRERFAFLSTPTQTAPPTPRVVWTEEMDKTLALAVRECVFDFEAVSKLLRNFVVEREQSDSARSSTSLIDSTECRKRWADLDFQGSGTQSISSSPFQRPPAYTRGSKPTPVVARTWEELNQLSLSQPSKVRPTFLPTLQDVSDAGDMLAHLESDETRPLRREEIVDSLRGGFGDKLKDSSTRTSYAAHDASTLQRVADPAGLDSNDFSDDPADDNRLEVMD